MKWAKARAANDAAPAPAAAAPEEKKEEPKAEAAKEEPKAEASSSEVKTSPAVRKLLADNNLSAEDVPASGKDGRLTKEDVQSFIREER